MIDSKQIQQVLDLAKQAGREILAMQRSAVGEMKADGSPVSPADRRAAEIVLNGLKDITPHIPIVCEENRALQNTAAQQTGAQNRAGAYWVVDPLDGTRSYLDGYGGYGVHAGLIVDDKPRAGVVYFPAEGCAYFTDGATGAWKQKDNAGAERIFVPTVLPAAETPPVLAVSWGLREAAARRKQTLPYEALSGVGGGRLCMVADGTVQSALMETPLSYWDLAAAHAVLLAAGGDLFALKDLSPMRYPSDRLLQPPSIAGDAALVAALHETALSSLQKIGC